MSKESDISNQDMKDILEYRIVKLEDKYTELAVKVAKLDVKMNLIAFLAGSTFIAVITGFALLILR